MDGWRERNEEKINKLKYAIALVFPLALFYLAMTVYIPVLIERWFK